MDVDQDELIGIHFQLCENSESIKLGRGMYIAMYCCILRNESGLWHTFSDKIFLENFLENFLEKMIFWKGVFLL